MVAHPLSIGWPRRALRVGAAPILISMACVGSAGADVYAYTDARGVLHVTNMPGDADYSLLVVMDKEVVAAVREQGAENQAQAAPVADAVGKYAQDIEQAARAEGLDKALLHAVITAESGYNATALSPKGAMGLMQLMPATAKRYGVADAYDPVQNIKGGAKYLRDLMRLFGNDLELVLAAYNAGEGAVARHGMRVPPYRETLAYVPKVLGYYKRYSRREL